MRRNWLPSLAFLALCIGCGAPTEQEHSTTTADPSKIPMVDQHPQNPLIANSSATGLGQEAVSDKDLAKYKKNYENAKKVHAAQPTNTGATDGYIIATVWYGSGTMYAGSLEAKPKYTGALNLYREALKVQPTSDKAKLFAAEALDNKQLIEGIYRDMGRPIPQ